MTLKGVCQMNDMADMPTIPELTFRRYHGKQDLPKMAKVISLSRAADGVDLATTEEDLAAQFDDPLDFDPKADVLIAEAGGKIVGLARVWRKNFENGSRAYGNSVELLPEWRGRGIRERLFEHNEEHIRRCAKKEGKEKTSFFEVWAIDSENEWRSIVLGKGYTPVQHELDLVRSLDEIAEIPLPEGLEIRPVKPEHYAKIWQANKEAMRKDWDFSEDEWDEQHMKAFMETSAFQPGLWQVAWDGDTLAGMVLNYIVDEENQQSGKKRGHTEYVFVREKYRGRGLARALLARSFKVLKERGMDEAMLRMEVENPHDPLRLYEGMGFRIEKHFTWYHKSVAP